MFKLKNILSQKQLATVYRALIESHLRYCSVIWGCLSNTKLESLQRLQNRARRLIECARHKDGWVCDWLDVRNLVKYDRLITTYKINNGLCPENLKNKFTQKVFWIPGSKCLERDPKANTRLRLIELLQSKIERVLEVERHKHNPLEEQLYFFLILLIFIFTLLC